MLKGHLLSAIQHQSLECAVEEHTLEREPERVNGESMYRIKPLNPSEILTLRALKLPESIPIRMERQTCLTLGQWLQ
jgi:hypothetical protein